MKTNIAGKGNEGGHNRGKKVSLAGEMGSRGGGRKSQIRTSNHSRRGKKERGE